MFIFFCSGFNMVAKATGERNKKRSIEINEYRNKIKLARNSKMNNVSSQILLDNANQGLENDKYV